jgi:hypothetical protein
MSALNALLDAVGAAPCLPGAKCRGRHALFDPPALGEPANVVEARHDLALGLCEYCPALARCESRLYSLPPQRQPVGVIAGTVRQPQ